MKTNQMKKKPSIKKTTIASLDNLELSQLKGGIAASAGCENTLIPDCWISNTTIILSKKD